MDIVARISEFGNKDGKPVKKISITHCGQL